MNEHSFSGLIADIELGKKSLGRVLLHRNQVLAQKDLLSDFFQTSAGGVVLHDFYNTVEKIFQQISLEMDGGLPKGDAWHQQLLRRMTVPASGRRPAVIDSDLAESLSEYLRFRHLFRHIYGFELVWERIEPLLDGMATIHAALVADLDQFIAYLMTAETD